MAKPVAQAGADQSYAASSLPKAVTLAGDATNPPIITWEWTMLSVPTGSTANVGVNGNFNNGLSSARNPSFTCDVVGPYVLQLRAQNMETPPDDWSDPDEDQDVAQTVIRIRTATLDWDYPGYKEYHYDQSLHPTLLSAEELLADHNARHEAGGDDEINVDGLSGVLATPQPTATHHTSHEHDGADEINVAGLSGVLADPQNAGAIHGRAILSNAPADGEGLFFNGTTWEPKSPSKYTAAGYVTTWAALGDAVYLSSSTEVGKDSATYGYPVLGIYEGVTGTVTIGGVVGNAGFVSGLTLSVNDIAYLSTTEGKLTNVPPSGAGEWVIPIGRVLDITGYTSPNYFCKIALLETYVAQRAA